MNLKLLNVVGAVLINIIGKVTTSDKYKVLKYDSIVYA